MKAKPKLQVIQGVSNDAEDLIKIAQPYQIQLTLHGTSDLLFHRWDNEVVATKAAAKKNSGIKKTDDTESMLYRDDKGFICLPSEYVRMSMVYAAKFLPDPRSPRKSAMDLMKAGIIANSELASLKCKEPDFIDRRRVMIQRSAITRCRPGIRKGWQAHFEFSVLLSEYINKDFFIACLAQAGQYIGVGDFRPTFGRFSIKSWKIAE